MPLRLFNLKREIGVYWRKHPLVRAATAMLVLIAAILLQYYLANRPLPVDVNAYKYTPATAKFKQEELVIENPVLDSSGILFSLDGQTNEFVNLHFEKARLSEETFARYKDKSPPPPVDMETIDFLTEDVKRKLEELKAEANVGKPQNDKKISKTRADNTKRDESGSCLIFMKAEVASNSKPPTRVHFYQLTSSGASRDFYMRIDADLFVSMKISPLINKEHSGDTWAPGCGKLLKVGDWEWHNSGFWEIKIIAAANSILHFTFLQKADLLWKAPTDLFQPFAFGSNPLQVQAISINKLSGDSSSNPSPTILTATAKDGPLLINNLMLNAEEIQLDFSGRALVQTHGNYVTGDFLDHLTKYPLIAGLLALGNMALLGWFISILKGAFSHQ